MKTVLILFLLTLLLARSRAGPFQNLDLEMVNTNTSTLSYDLNGGFISGKGPISDLLPHWQLYWRNVTDVTVQAISIMGYNSLANDIAPVGVMSLDTYPYFLFPVHEVGFQGNHVLMLSQGLAIGGAYILKQRGDIPVWASRIVLQGHVYAIIDIDGTILNAYGGGIPPQTIADISHFAGQKDVDLTITLLDWSLISPFPGGTGGPNLLDRVFFKSEPPSLQMIRDKDGKPRVVFHGQPGTTFFLESSTDLSRGWTQSGKFTLSPSFSGIGLDTGNTTPVLYFRTKVNE